mmetsp:Transcript_13791/g.41176  ORF Transcript_13791/g.41176 Transcript_13791/m.41176 type:complete len:255 (-) Transcript_13791:714-1478(-)
MEGALPIGCALLASFTGELVCFKLASELAGSFLTHNVILVLPYVTIHGCGFYAMLLISNFLARHERELPRRGHSLINVAGLPRRRLATIAWFDALQLALVFECIRYTPRPLAVLLCTQVVSLCTHGTQDQPRASKHVGPSLYLQPLLSTFALAFMFAPRFMSLGRAICEGRHHAGKRGLRRCLSAAFFWFSSQRLCFNSRELTQSLALPKTLGIWQRSTKRPLCAPMLGQRRIMTSIAMDTPRSGFNMLHFVTI